MILSLRTAWIHAILLALVLWPTWVDEAEAAPKPAAVKPNILVILADDLGYGDLGCYGQKLIQTPHLDRMAAEGIRFTQTYCGTSVCAPCRCSLMTGLHMGHAPIRANREIKPEGQKPLPAGTFTVARLLKDAGYATACIGKWGLGFIGTTGDPLQNGFDHFFGYNCQRKAHEYYPEYLWRDDQKVQLDGKQYAHDLMTDEALQWVREQRDRRFFLYLAYTIPHGKYQVPELGPYADKPWPEQAKKYAAMVSRMDRDIGRLLDLLKELSLDRNTLVLFASDNGSAFAPESDVSKLFGSSAGLRGFKRSMYEGGLRVPMIVRWPGRVPTGKVSHEPWAFWDVLPTFAELAGTRIPGSVQADGVSVVPLLLGQAMPAREYFYWELHEGQFLQAARFGGWKAVRPGFGRAIELYDLNSDPAEQRDLAAEQPEVVARAEQILRTARTDSPDWPVNARAPKAKTKNKPQGATP